MSEQQRKELLAIAGPKLQGAGVLDYVAAWYLKAAQLAQNTGIKVALVSTNSITQGEQVSILWGEMLRLGMHIHFAHRTFKWSNEARGNAQVFCVIVGFGQEAIPVRRLFDYATVKGVPQELRVKNINPYLVDAQNILVSRRNKPLSSVPEMTKGSQPTDGGYLLLTKEERDDLLKREPNALPFIRTFIGSQEFINGGQRYCLWLKDASPSELKGLPLISERLRGVREMRLASSKAATVKFAAYPQLFMEDRQPLNDYLAVPEVSSENRYYVPIGFLSSEVVASNKLQIISNGSQWLFGVLTSAMHMTWMRYVTGRLKSDYSYSNSLVYNNFPFPPSPSAKQVAAVEAAARQVLAARAQFPQESLATLYDPLTMPPALVKAHQTLDRAVDLCYRTAAFPTELSRLEFLFEQYRQLQTPLLPPAKTRRKTKA